MDVCPISISNHILIGANIHIYTIYHLVGMLERLNDAKFRKEVTNVLIGREIVVLL